MPGAYVDRNGEYLLVTEIRAGGIITSGWHNHGAIISGIEIPIADALIGAASEYDGRPIYDAANQTANA